MSHRNGPRIDLAARVMHEDGWVILRGDKPQGFYYTRRHARDFAYGKRVVRARRIVVWKGGKS